MALAVLLTLGGLDVEAQDGRRERGPRMRQDAGVESIMSMRERLELTDDQIAQLDVIRAEGVAERSALQADMGEMRSRLRAGEIRQSEMMAFMEDRRDGREGVAEARRERVDGILQPEQRASLEQIRAESRAFRQGQRSGRRQAGMRGRGAGDLQRAFQRGPRGGSRAFRGGERTRRPGGEGVPGGS